MATPEDARLAKASRLLRRQAGLRQCDTVSRWLCQQIEAGWAGSLPVNTVRSHFAQFGAKAHVTVWWEGAALDRLLDSSHAEVVEIGASTLSQYGFRVKPEFSFNDYGDRGSIDLFAGHDATRALFVGEAK